MDVVTRNRKPEGEATGRGARGNGAVIDNRPVNWQDVEAEATANERNDRIKEATRVRANVFQSLDAGAQDSVIGAAIQKIAMPDYAVDPEFTQRFGQVLDTDPEINGLQMTNEEIEFIQRFGNQSLEAYQNAKEMVKEKRISAQQFADNPAAGVAGAILGDLPLIVAPLGAYGIAGKTGHGIRTGLRATEMGTTIYGNDQLGQSDLTVAIVGAALGVDQLFDMRAMAKGFRAGSNAIEARAATMGDNTFMGDEFVGADARTSGVLSDAPELIDDWPTMPAPVNPVMGKVPDYPQSFTGAMPTPVNPVRPLPPTTPKLDTMPQPVNPVVGRIPEPVPAPTVRAIDPDAPAAAVETVKVSDAGELMTSAGKRVKKLEASLGGRTSVDMGNLASVKARILANPNASETVKWLLNRMPDEYLQSTMLFVKNSPYVKKTRGSKYGMTTGLATMGVTRARERVSSIVVGMPKGTVVRSMDDVVDNMQYSSLAHEMAHIYLTQAIRRGGEEGATTALGRAAKELEDMRFRVKTLLGSDEYGFTNIHEFVAEIIGNKAFRDQLNRIPSDGKLTLLDKAIRILARLFGSEAGTELDQALALLDELMYAADADTQRVIFSNMDSDTFRELSTYITGFKPKMGESVTSFERRVETAEAKKMFDGVKGVLKKSFSLYDNIASGSEDLAKMLVSNATGVGKAQQSVADVARQLKLEFDLRAVHVEDAFIKALREDGISQLDMFFNRRAYMESRRELESELTKYLNTAYSADIAGKAVPTPPRHLKGLVDAWVESDWSTAWYDRMLKEGLFEEGTVRRSKYYNPRQYSYSRAKQFDPADIKDLLKGNLKTKFPEMDSALLSRVAKSWADRILEVPTTQRGKGWRQMINGMSHEEIAAAMKDAGIDPADIENFMHINVPKTGATNPNQRLRKRIEFDVNAEIITKSGRAMTLADIMDTDILRGMKRYNATMAGRTAFARKGVEDYSELAKQIDETARKMEPEVAAKWLRAVDDTIDTLLGHSVGNDVPELLRGAQNVAGTVMLKNSGLYQLTDMAIAMKEFGMKRVMRQMAKGGLWRKGTTLCNDKEWAGRLHSLLNGAYQNDVKFRQLLTYTDDMLDLTNSSQIFRTTQNMSAAARLANGFAGVHRMMVNLNSGMLIDEVHAVAKGGDSRILRNFGMDDEMVKALRVQADKLREGEGLFTKDLQDSLEGVLMAAQDQLMQNIRTGHTSHFAQMNPIGKLVVGYQSFALAATNKLLRRYNGDGQGGLAMLFVYQYPLMLLAMMAKQGMDGKEIDAQTTVTQAVGNMSLIGGLSILSPLFTGETPRHSLVSMGYITQSLGAVQNAVSNGGMSVQDASKILPYAQEIVPLRTLINVMGD